MEWLILIGKKVYCAWCKNDTGVGCEGGLCRSETFSITRETLTWNLTSRSTSQTTVVVAWQYLLKNRWGWTWGAIIVDLPLQFLRLLYPPLCRFKSWHICKSCWQLQGPFSYFYRSGCYNFIQEFVHSSRPKSIIPYYCKSKRKSVPNSNWYFKKVP